MTNAGFGNAIVAANALRRPKNDCRLLASVSLRPLARSQLLYAANREPRKRLHTFSSQAANSRETKAPASASAAALKPPFGCRR